MVAFLILSGCGTITDSDNGIGIVEIGESGAMNPFMPATIEGGCFIFGKLPDDAVIDFNNGKCTVTMQKKEN